MDDDDLRRGRPTAHKAFDEATAILSGDGLLTYAFDVVADPATHPDGNLRAALSGGAALPPDVARVFVGLGLNLLQGYGMTETSPVACANRPDDNIPASVGTAAPGVEIRIGEHGALLIKGPNITPGYWNKPEATASAFTDGWLHTGDAARLDEEGFVYIVDRWKDMYISGGENVYPAEVENVLFQLPQVADAAIIGVPNERWGEVGMAIIVKKPGQTIEEGDVIRHCLGRLAKFKVPQAVQFVDVLPRNATGKVLKRELRTQYVGAAKPAIT